MQCLEKGGGGEEELGCCRGDREKGLDDGEVADVSRRVAAWGKCGVKEREKGLGLNVRFGHGNEVWQDDGKLRPGRGRWRGFE